MIVGYVQDVKEKTTKFGPMYDIIVNGTTYGVGKFAPKGYAKGDYVQFEAVQKGNYWNLTHGSLSKIDPPAGTPAPKPAPGPVVDNRQEVISKQAALNSAISHVSNLIAAGAIPAGAASKGPKMVDKLDAITAEYTMHFYEQSTGNKLELNVKGEGEDANAAGNFDE